MKTSFSHKLSITLVPALVAALLRLWFKTCSVTVINGQAMPTLEQSRQQPSVAVFFHYSILYVFYHLRNYSAAVMVSASKDGDYIARLAEILGFTSVRGSKHNKGVAALREMLKLLRRGNNCGIVADGSRGPARIVQPGAVALASRSGAPIIPMVWSASRYIRFRSWDCTALPKPFAKVYFIFGEPLSVPQGLDAEQLEVYRAALEERLNALYDQAWKIFGRSAH